MSKVTFHFLHPRQQKNNEIKRRIQWLGEKKSIMYS
jgi:hypothetical protein